MCSVAVRSARDVKLFNKWAKMDTESPIAAKVSAPSDVVHLLRSTVSPGETTTSVSCPPPYCSPYLFPETLLVRGEEPLTRATPKFFPSQLQFNPNLPKHDHRKPLRVPRSDRVPLERAGFPS